MMRYWRSVTTVVVAVCLLVVGCVKESGWEQAMQALKADPMASVSWDGLELLGTVETVNDSPKPSPPGITRCYKLSIPTREAFEKVMSSARQYEWNENLEEAAPSYAKAWKIIDGYRVSLRVSTDSYRCEKEYPDYDFRITLTEQS
ncbi:hypothetical protein EII34_10330 [Arachnia propionica]|uniref:Lipoprotein n=1 Tax=Arachnia propionica TaxID=1750 RepID=A0A3P1T4K5_9ACTN|nr:hypothetical protein [Arachnia propionica]RRD04447.1 hypothetical protein EII34_10330 [Arachnia propionica]